MQHPVPGGKAAPPDGMQRVVGPNTTEEGKSMASGMFLQIIRSEGLFHLSYLIGHDGRAAVIDPRRDCRIYVDMAHSRGARIEYIFETHRNEDYVIGSKELAHLTGAEIRHGGRLDFEYGRAVADGDTFDLGDLRLEILETPGHTFESISIAVTDTGFGEAPVAVFTGDALFVGDVGRTDFFPDRAEEVAGLLYESIFRKILPLGDQAILYPAHGAGSVCGEGMAEREFSTLGMERISNPVLQMKDRDVFIRFKASEHHDKPPYFRRMEKYNLEGSAPPG
jgi:hydroxyacylglutathione hydrolase